MKFWYFHDAFEFPKIRGYKSFDNSITFHPNSGRIFIIIHFSLLAQLRLIIYKEIKPTFFLQSWKLEVYQLNKTANCHIDLSYKIIETGLKK